MEVNKLLIDNDDFFNWLVGWYNNLPAKTVEGLLGGTELSKIGIFVVDMIEGFTEHGSLASPRNKALVPQIRALLIRMLEVHGLEPNHVIFLEDNHTEDSLEFEQFAPHAILGTTETLTHPELRSIPGFANTWVVHKNNLDAWLAQDMYDAPKDIVNSLETILFVGNCTDLCIMRNSMTTMLLSNEANHKRRVIVAENMVNTYDLPVNVANEINAIPHPGDLMHLFALYLMHLNGIEIVKIKIGGSVNAVSVQPTTDNTVVQ